MLRTCGAEHHKYHYLQAPIPTKARMNGASLNIQRGVFRKFTIVEIVLEMFQKLKGTPIFKKDFN